MAEIERVTAEWLKAHLDDPSIRILEICARDDDAVYRTGHVPGARWVYWKSACWHATDRDLVSSEAMARHLGGLGIGPDTTLVLYGDPVQHGTYALWAFALAGHRRLALLDGGRKHWDSTGRPMSQDVPRPEVVAYPVPEPRSAGRVGR